MALPQKLYHHLSTTCVSLLTQDIVVWPPQEKGLNMQNLPPWLIAETILRGPATICVLVFALSWIVRRHSVILAGSARRIRTLKRVGIIGPLAILLAHSILGTIALFWPVGAPMPRWLPFLPVTLVAETLNRPVALTAAAILLFIALLAFHREPVPPPGQRALSPKRAWYSYTPKTLLWAGLAVALLILFTSLWQAFAHTGTGSVEYLSNIGKTDPRRIPSSDPVGPPGAFGLASNAPAIVALFLLGGTLISTLSIDANRPTPLGGNASEVRASRVSTARLLTWITFGALLLGLGAVLVAAWPPITYAVDVGDREEGTAGLFYGSSFQGMVDLMRMLAPILQGVGAALLLRVSVDTARAARALPEQQNPLDWDPATTTVQAKQ